MLSSVPEKSLATIVLAAGFSRRFGSDKRQAPYSSDLTLLQRSVELVLPYSQKVFVALRADDDPDELLGKKLLANPKVIITVAERAVNGMGCSLADAANAVIEDESVSQLAFEGVLVQLADMPFVKNDTLNKLVASFTADTMTVPCYQCQHRESRWGHPVIFGRRWLGNLQRLQGDRGGRSILKAHPSARQEIVVNDAGILRDIDVPQDLTVENMKLAVK